jgi:hypothetical protein
MSAGPAALGDSALISVVFAAIATEAFINELGTILERESVAGFQPSPPEYEAAATAIANEEKANHSTYDKFAAAHRALTGARADKGSEPFQSFRALMSLRDLIVHSKPERNAPENSIPPALAPLIRRGLTFDWEGLTSPTNRLLTDDAAEWACESSLAMIRSTLDLVPASGGSNSIDLMLRDKFGPQADVLLDPQANGGSAAMAR